MTRILLSIAIMALTTYLLRALPLTIFTKPIKSVFLCSFLVYVPYAVLAAMTIPDILFATSDLISAVIGLAVAVILAWFGRSLTTVALCSSAAVFAAEFIIPKFG
jgi:branched-subunit amino acid transport protein